MYIHHLACTLRVLHGHLSPFSSKREQGEKEQNMANQEQVERLLTGVEGWNKWRRENPDIAIDLEEASLIDADIRGANLGQASLVRARLIGTDLRVTNLAGANLERASLVFADLSGAMLSEANFSGADLERSRFSNADLNKANLGGAFIGNTDFGNLNLSKIRGLSTVRHTASSTIGTNTIQLSKGKVPDVFLRGCGLSDWEIESAKLYQPGHSVSHVKDIVSRIFDLRANRAFQINQLFISYSYKDMPFVNKMEKALYKKSIRFWQDIHDAPAGPLENIIDHAIQQNPIILLVLSTRSIKGNWVQPEVRKARELEIKFRRHVLCPVVLDSSWETCDWPEVMREQIMEYNILDFSKWKDEREFGWMFLNLVEGLDLFYKEK
jgi:uncharacterized protein YjbI with pentapeptide repeats